MAPQTLPFIRKYIQATFEAFRCFRDSRLDGANTTNTEKLELQDAHETPHDATPWDRLRAQQRRLIEHLIEQPTEATMSIAELAVSFELEPEDVEVLLLVAGPTLHPELTRQYALLSPDYDRFATAGLVAEVLAFDDAERFADYRQRCELHAPLRTLGLIVEAGHDTGSPAALQLIHIPLQIQDQIIAFPLGAVSDGQVAASLAPFCSRLRQEVRFESLGLDEDIVGALVEAVRSRRLPMVLEGADAASKERVACAVASALGKGLLRVDLTGLLELPRPLLSRRLHDLVCEARPASDLVYLATEDLPETVAYGIRQVLATVLLRHPVLLSTHRPPRWCSELAAGWPLIVVPPPNEAHRQQLWRMQFDGDRHEPDADALAMVSRRYHMTELQIRRAATEARRQARIQSHRAVSLGDLEVACRRQFSHQLTDLAQHLPASVFGPEDLILPPRERRRFEELLLFATHHQTVFVDWSFEQAYLYGRGLTVLFYGPPGTGKTMAAMIIAVFGLGHRSGHPLGGHKGRPYHGHRRRRDL